MRPSGFFHLLTTSFTTRNRRKRRNKLIHQTDTEPYEQPTTLTTKWENPNFSQLTFQKCVFEINLHAPGNQRQKVRPAARGESGDNSGCRLQISISLLKAEFLRQLPHSLVCEICCQSSPATAASSISGPRPSISTEAGSNPSQQTGDVCPEDRGPFRGERLSRRSRLGPVPLLTSDL